MEWVEEGMFAVVVDVNDVVPVGWFVKLEGDLDAR